MKKWLRKALKYLDKKRLFRQSKVNLPDAMPPPRGLARAKLLIACLEQPLEAFQNWSCILVTNKGNYRNSEVVCIERDWRGGSVNVYVTFKPMPVVGCGRLQRLLVYDAYNQLVGEMSATNYLQPGETVRPTYSVSL